MKRPNKRRRVPDRRPSIMEAVFGTLAFVALFGLWVVLPSRLRKRRQDS